MVYFYFGSRSYSVIRFDVLHRGTTKSMEREKEGQKCVVEAGLDTNQARTDGCLSSLLPPLSPSVLSQAFHWFVTKAQLMDHKMV